MTSLDDDIVIAPLIDKDGRPTVGWAPTRARRATVEQREYLRRLRDQRRAPGPETKDKA